MDIRIAVLTIGTEITQGLVCDTNSYYLSKELFKHGFEVNKHVSVPDDRKTIIEALTDLSKHQVVIISGGLGPTSDDITREAVAEAFHLELYLDQNTLNLAGGAHSVEASRKMASFPKGSLILRTAADIAAGFILNQNNAVIIALPGVPEEMKQMFHSAVLPQLNSMFMPVITLRRRLFKIANLREVEIEEKISPLNEQFSYGLLPKLGEVHLYINVKNSSPDKAEKKLDELDRKISGIFGSNLFARDDETLEEVLVKELIKKGLKIATAESSTGGLVGERISRIAGSSEIFLGGYITYAYELKEKLGVAHELLMQKGAVNEEAAAIMASQTRKKAESDIGVSVTGIAGPGGATSNKPVGLHYIGVDSDKKSLVKEYIFKGNRQETRWQASQAALLLVREVLID